MDKVHYIREIMMLKGVSISELARRLGVTQQTASMQVTHDVRLSKAKKIADALGVPMSTLFTEPRVPGMEEKNATIAAYIRCPRCGEELEVSVKRR